ncbi:MAG: hypothetical protein ACKOZM_00045 [Flavobacteriales bacterium]
MSRNHIFLATLLGITTFTSCIIPGARRERTELELQRNDSLMLIDLGNFQFRMVMPKDLMITHEPSVHLSADEATLTISCGSDFQVLVSRPDNPTKAMAVANEQQGVFTHRLLDCEDESCVYKRILPDGQPFDYGLYQITTVGETTYVFQSSPDGEFNLNAAMHMKLALASVKI